MGTQTGGCHCGKVRYEAVLDLGEPVIECNCSHCQMKGTLLAFIPADNFTLISGEEALTEYRFNKKKIAHLFCNICGVQPLGRGENTEGNPMVAVNVRTIDNIELPALTRLPFNGREQM